MTATVSPVSSNGARSLLQNAVRVRRYFTRRIAVSREDADDLTQEVCARFLAVQHPAAMMNAERYLFGIARHVLADFLTERKDRCETAMPPSEHVPEADTFFHPCAHDPAATVCALNLLTVLLDELPGSYRTVLLAHEGEGYSCREVANQLGFSEATVRTYLKRARSHLRDLRRRM